MRPRAAIVGLGQVGMLFDDDPGRRRIWTHFSAYERLAGRFELVAVCDPNEERTQRALARRPSLRAFATIEELLDMAQPDVVSLCTPVSIHAEQILASAGRVRAIICEKPLSADSTSAKQAVEACATSGTLLAVNYYKRFEGAVQRATRLLGDGTVGSVRAATALYAGPLDAVGSHAVDLLQFLVGPLDLADVVSDEGGGCATFRFDGNRIATLLCTGPREDLVFEVDLICSEGRIRILDNCERLTAFRFERSTRYDGYRELVALPNEPSEGGEPFLLLFEEVADALDGSEGPMTSDGASALFTQRILERIETNGRNG